MVGSSIILKPLVNTILDLPATSTFLHFMLTGGSKTKNDLYNASTQLTYDKWNCWFRTLSAFNHCAAMQHMQQVVLPLTSVLCRMVYWVYWTLILSILPKRLDSRQKQPIGPTAACHSFQQNPVKTHRILMKRMFERKSRVFSVFMVFWIHFTSVLWWSGSGFVMFHRDFFGTNGSMYFGCLWRRATTGKPNEHPQYQRNKQGPKTEQWVLQLPPLVSRSDKLSRESCLIFLGLGGKLGSHWLVVAVRLSGWLYTWLILCLLWLLFFVRGAWSLFCFCVTFHMAVLWFYWIWLIWFFSPAYQTITWWHLASW